MERTVLPEASLGRKETWGLEPSASSTSLKRNASAAGMVAMAGKSQRPSAPVLGVKVVDWGVCELGACLVGATACGTRGDDAPLSIPVALDMAQDTAGFML